MGISFTNHNNMQAELGCTLHKDVYKRQAVFLADLLEGFHACTVVVKKAVDAFVICLLYTSIGIFNLIKITTAKKITVMAICILLI